MTLPLRVLYFPDYNPITILLLGPAFEESLKLAGAILVLTVASATLRGGRDPALALRYWLFLIPWLVGALDGILEGVVGYPGQGGTAFAMREIAHATFVALAFAGALGVWKRRLGAYFGLGFGYAAGFAAHIWFNGLAFLADVYGIDYAYQMIYLALVFVLALVVLAREVRGEPASEEARTFLPASGPRLHP